MIKVLLKALNKPQKLDVMLAFVDVFQLKRAS